MKNKTPRFSLISLGCPKNTVDSEGLLATMALGGFEFAAHPSDSDVCLVNTCGFLESARAEAAEVLQEVVAQRGKKKRPLVVALGCLVERVESASQLTPFLDAADLTIGFADYPRLPALCISALAGTKVRRTHGGFVAKTLPKTYMSWLDGPRMRMESVATAYLKIGEGCSNRCAYCSIPLIRGDRISRPMESILQEARDLVASGAKELVLIAQDTTAYGMDFSGGRPKLAGLLRKLLKMPDPIWFRVLYAHPRHLADDILSVMASDSRVCPYLDLPLQHVSDNMLKQMRRGYTRAQLEKVIARVHRRLPHAALRTTYIVGHPGESEKDFAELLTFVKEGHFEHAGAFVWSPEPGTLSAHLSHCVPIAIAEERQEALMEAQAKVAFCAGQKRAGQKTTLLLERRNSRGWIGRTPWQAPEVDGHTVLSSTRKNDKLGGFVEVQVVEATVGLTRARRV